MKLIINTDGGARGNPGPAGIGVVFRDEQNKIIGEYKKYIGETTNNVAEYKALILGLSQALALSPKPLTLEIRMDSQLVVRQMQGKYKIKEPTLQALAGEAFELLKNFKSVVFVDIRREKNKEADKLVNEAIDEELV